MTNILTFPQAPLRTTLAERAPVLIDCFATKRRFGDDVYWLKENAENLSVLEATNTSFPVGDLAPISLFYEELPRWLTFFPQYYRFLLSICLDLEDLGMPGDQGLDLCDWAARSGLAEAELSDLQRAEAHRLLGRRDVKPPSEDPELELRLHRFINRSETFAMPNQKAAYELTHIVFYLSEYGRCDPHVSREAITSLEFAGVLAFLDQNADLLAEVCIALRYAGVTPSPIWENFVTGNLAGFEIEAGPEVEVSDDYHCYLVSNWLSAVRGDKGLGQAIPPGRVRFESPVGIAGPLRGMSAIMFDMQEARTADWTQMRPLLEGAVDPDALEVLALAERSIDHFEAFFEGFSRVSRSFA